MEFRSELWYNGDWQVRFGADGREAWHDADDDSRLDEEEAQEIFSYLEQIIELNEQEDAKRAGSAESFEAPREDTP